MHQLSEDEAGELATGAPGLLTIGSTVLLIDQPTTADKLLLRKYLSKLHATRNSSAVAQVAAAFKDLPPEMRELAVKAAVETDRTKIEPGGAAVMDLLSEPEGCAFWVWLLARKQQPQLQRDAVQSLVSEGNVEQVLADLLEATSLKTTDPNSTGRTGSRR